ncbi:MAG: site-2 protease family protein [Parcubacteria group bacterium]|nr:site-2 protease family protein [Parcubacteria group bacterium]
MTILIVFISLIVLVVLHELGHFLVAKKFGVKVEEFGVGLPPRIAGVRLGETLYSLNLLPLGAFVRLEGEEGTGMAGNCSYAGKSVLQRSFIVASGVVAFWLVAFLILTFLGATFGIPSQVQDEYPGNAQVQIVAVVPGSPAAAAGLAVGDVIEGFRTQELPIEMNTVSAVQEFTQGHAGQDIIMRVRSGKESYEVTLNVRERVPEGQGPLGVALARTALVSYPWYEAPVKGFLFTWQFTVQVVQGLWQLVAGLVSFRGVPAGTQFLGVVGIFDLLQNAFAGGLASFLLLLALLAVYLAVFNALPIPAVDGGKLLFLAIEAIRKKPVQARIEQRIHAAFFLILISLLLFVTLQDISRLTGN